MTNKPDEQTLRIEIATNQSDSAKPKSNNVWVVVALLFCAPLALFLIYRYRKLWWKNTAARVAVTAWAIIWSILALGALTGQRW